METSPFNIEYNTNKDISYSFITIALFYNAIVINNYSVLGPFVKFSWLDFCKNIPIYEAGIKFLYRNEIDFNFENRTIGFYKPLLFQFIGTDAGLRYSQHKLSAYAVATIDASVLVPALTSFLHGQAESNTAIAKPDYKDSLPKREER